MRLAEILWAGSLLVVGACRQSQTHAMMGEPAPAVEAVAKDAGALDAHGSPGASESHDGSSQEPSFVQISAFDCEKVYEAPGVPEAVGPITAGISAWRGGGPNGANWNADDLRCVVATLSPCSSGRLQVVIRIGTRIAAKKDVNVSAAGKTTVQLDVPAGKWRKNLDEPFVSPKVLKLPYQTAIFRAGVQLTCAAPFSASPADWKYPSVTADASFVAGFAWGE